MSDESKPVDVAEEGGFAANEYEREPVPENKTKGPGSFLGLFASEHVAATELIIGPLFITAGATAMDVLGGLLLGNLLAVLTWTFVTAPIAVKKRMTLYLQLEKIGGPAIIDVYNIANGILWCCLAGAFIYVSATALLVPEITGLEGPKLGAIYPHSFAMVAVVLAVGAVIVVVAAKGYDAVSRFANIAAPWMVLMFVVFGLSALPKLGITSIASFWEVANEKVWTGKALGATKFGFWNIVCFAWFGNMAWHFGMGDLSIFRYARKASYGWISGVGMFLGHYIAWITSGLIFAVQLGGRPATLEDSMAAGPMTYEIAGVSGLLLVVLAGWTTANPVIYRAGLAFQAIKPSWSRAKVTFVAGIIGSVIAVFPGFAGNFLSVAMIYGLTLAPMGGVIFADHYFMKKLGMHEFYAAEKGKKVHWPALVSWLLSVAFWIILHKYAGIDLTYLCIPCWAFAMVVYLIFSKIAQKPSEAKENS